MSSVNGRLSFLYLDRVKTLSKRLALTSPGFAPSEKQNPQIVENLESEWELREILEAIAVRVMQAHPKWDAIGDGIKVVMRDRWL